MMYHPNVYTLNVEQLLSGELIDTAVGVLQVTLYCARGLKGSKISGGAPDPYVSLSINNRKESARTKYKHSTYVSVQIPETPTYIHFVQDRPFLERNQVHPCQLADRNSRFVGVRLQ